MTTYTLRYALEGSASASSSSSSSGIATYSLVELPAALAAAAKSALSSSDASSSILSKLVIKGQPNDDAVLCTDDTTYTMRSVQNSNSLLLCRPQLSGSGSKGEGKGKGKGKKRAAADYLNIESTLHQTLELDLCVPRLEKIGDLLRGQEWTLEINEEERQEQLERGSEQHPLKKVEISVRLCPSHAMHLLTLPACRCNPAQAEPTPPPVNGRHSRPCPRKRRSNNGRSGIATRFDSRWCARLASAWLCSIAAPTHSSHPVFPGCCRPIPPATLTALLQNILQTLVMLSHSPSAVAGFPLDELASSLCKDDGIPEDVTKQVIQWFGEPVEPVQGSEHMSRSTQHWRLKVDEVAREIGRDLLARNGVSGSELGEGGSPLTDVFAEQGGPAGNLHAPVAGDRRRAILGQVRACLADRRLRGFPLLLGTCDLNPVRLILAGLLPAATVPDRFNVRHLNAHLLPDLKPPPGPSLALLRAVQPQESLEGKRDPAVPRRSRCRCKEARCPHAQIHAQDQGRRHGRAMVRCSWQMRGRVGPSHCFDDVRHR